MKNGKLTEVFGVNFSEADAAKIKARAQEEGRSAASLIRLLTLRGLSEKGAAS